MSDTVTLIAGILLTSVGLLALLPYVLKHGWRQPAGGLAVDSGHAPVPAAVEDSGGGDAPPPTGVSKEELEELLAQLFSLRLTVSDATAEVMETQEALSREWRAAPGLAGEVA